MEPYIIFNGTSSEDLGFVVEQLPDEHKPRRATSEIQIPGRPGKLIEDLGSYEPIQSNIKINCFGHATTEVYAWLRGEGWMTTSQDPEFMRWVSFYDQFNDSRFRVEQDCYDTITIPVRMQPYKHLVVQEPIIITSASVFAGMGNENAAPILEITGSGDVELMINGASVLIDYLAGTIYLDCDAMTAYTEAAGVKAFAGRYVTVIDDVWPYLQPGMNEINWAGNITQLSVQPWWRWL